MPAQHAFTVKQEEGATEHKIVASVITFDEATEKQRRTMWAEGLAAATVKVQGTLRRRLAKGVRGAALNAEATTAFTAIVNAGVAEPAKIDAAANKLSLAQCAALEAIGVVVLNKPEK